MGMQLRPKDSGGPLYNPERDFAYCHMDMVQCCISAFNSGRWPKLFETLVTAVPRNDGDTDEQHEDKCWENLISAKDVYCNYLNICCEDAEETYEDVIERSGWGNIEGPYQFAWLAMLGVVMTGQIFVGLRDTTAYETPVRTDVENLVKHSHKSRLVHNLPASDDLKQDLKAVIEKLRDENVDWEVIDRIIAREKSRE